ncbi:MAG: hypothetical protein O7D30_10015, partial [Rickettsia endosymbiont of Ixodes persulcatus]|nr:hypothetical protein [Rickettsia endosymbiont of Ixodes persulcatus]
MWFETAQFTQKFNVIKKSKGTFCRNRMNLLKLFARETEICLQEGDVEKFLRSLTRFTDLCISEMKVCELVSYK